MVRAYVCMKISEYPPPPLVWTCLTFDALNYNVRLYQWLVFKAKYLCHRLLLFVGPAKKKQLFGSSSINIQLCISRNRLSVTKKQLWKQSLWFFSIAPAQRQWILFASDINLDKPSNDLFSEKKKPIKNEYSAYRRFFCVWMGRKVLILTWRKTLNSFTGFMKVSDPIRLKLVISYEQSNQGITNYFFHDIMFLCALGHMQWTS